MGGCGSVVEMGARQVHGCCLRSPALLGRCVGASDASRFPPSAEDQTSVLGIHCRFAHVISRFTAHMLATPVMLAEYAMRRYLMLADSNVVLFALPSINPGAFLQRRQPPNRWVRYGTAQSVRPKPELSHTTRLRARGSLGKTTCLLSSSVAGCAKTCDAPLQYK